MSQNKSYSVKATVAAILGIGICILLGSIYFISSFLAIIGLSLVFWGATLLYIIPTKNQNSAIYLHASAEVTSENIEKILTANGSDQQGIYLPPQLVPDSQKKSGSTIFIPNATYDKKNATQKQKDPSNGIFITPPGSGLCKILEFQLGNSFSKINTQQFIEILPNLLTKINEFAELVNIQTTKNTLTVEITKSIFEVTCQDTDKQPQTHKQVGCLLSSAIACALTLVTNKPIVINSETRNLQQNTTKIEYIIIEKM